MFINKTNIKLLAVALLTALAASSCLNLDETKEGGYGYLTISGLDLNVQVESLVPTKAEPVTLKSLGIDAAPVLSEIVFTLERHNNDSGTKSSETEAVQPNVELPLEAGSYTLYVNYNGNYGADGFGEALFKEEMSYPVTITPGERTQLEISLPLINSLIAVSVTDELKKDFTPSKISISYDKQTVTVKENVYYFVPAASEVTVTVTGTTAGVSTLLEHTFTTPAAAKYADVKFGKSTTDLPSITLGDVSGGAFEGGLYFSPAVLNNISSDHTVVYKYQLKGASDWNTAEVSDVNGYKYLNGLTDGETYLIKACVGNIESDPVEFSPVSLESCVTVAAVSGYPQHYTENNELAGTKMQASVTVNLPSVVAQLAVLSVESGAFKKDTDAIGTFNVIEENKTLTNATAKSFEISNSATWPYFPKGEGYVLDAKVKCVLPNRTVTSEPVSSSENITSPAPSNLFTVTASANTTYSYYTDPSKGAGEANKKTAENVFDITSSVSISENILSKDVYEDILPSVTYSVGGKSTTGTYGRSKTHSMAQTEISGLAWGTHSLTAEVTFDGASATSAGHPCVITGLPYSVSFYDITSTPAKWTVSGDISWTGYGWNSGDSAKYLRLCGASKYEDRGKALSPAFTIPSESGINIKTTVDCMHYASSGDAHYIYINANTSACPELTTNRTSINDSVNFNNFDNVNDVVNDITLTKSTPCISVTHDVPRQGVRTEFIGIKSFKAEYR